jgi:hypothetical protein
MSVLLYAFGSIALLLPEHGAAGARGSAQMKAIACG